ncbi:AI-2E family transporter [Aquisalimonas lutea]|uniref:AI-2E family transporter n=1 Tax=Aquisalimonas lutea TaxID=1327750 RepID=UPI0025B34733|nr:AI-2E family transporter [Aquisalimonas lutea]MDN3519490.1 AI-2E family transporter [Aquisalimonas lutea]
MTEGTQPAHYHQLWFLLAAVVLAGFLIYLLQPILLPFLVGGLLAYLGDPMVDRLQRLGLGRTPGVVAVFVVLTLLATGAVLILLPLIGRQVNALGGYIPVAVEWFQGRLVPMLETYLGVDPEALDLGRLRTVLAENWQTGGDVAAMLVSRVGQSGMALLGLLANLALIPVVAFYLMRDWDEVMARIRGLLPRTLEPTVTRLAGECDDVLGAFLRGQLLVMLSLGVVYTVGLWLVGLDLAILIGMLAGVANIVPYLGFIIGFGAAAAAVVIQFSDWLLPLVLVLAVFSVGQLLEGALLTPLLVGDRIGLHPVAVIFAVLAGGQLFGFTGVLLALPVAAMIMVLLRYAHQRYKASSFYEHRESPGEATEPD